MPSLVSKTCSSGTPSVAKASRSGGIFHTPAGALPGVPLFGNAHVGASELLRIERFLT